jgi:subtilisin family serine protease
MFSWDDGFSVFYKRGKMDMDDQNGHGTHVAGTIAAIDNDIGSIGVAPGATIVPVRVLDRRGSGTISGVIAGVDFVAAKAEAGDCVNMSLGGGKSTALDKAVKNAAAESKAYFALAAGNDGEDASTTSPALVGGFSDTDNIFTIAAIDVNDQMPSWSNYGEDVEYAAPGVSIVSLWNDGGTKTISGTSMAAPHACAVLMLTGAGSDDDAVNFYDETIDTRTYPIIFIPPVN